MVRTLSNELSEGSTLVLLQTVLPGLVSRMLVYMWFASVQLTAESKGVREIKRSRKKEKQNTNEERGGERERDKERSRAKTKGIKERKKKNRKRMRRKEREKENKK